MRWAARCHYDWPITTSAATISARAAAAPQTSQDATRHLAKPASAITKQAAAISSAIDATPLKVSIGLSWGGHCPSTRHQCFLGPALPRIPRWGRVSRRTRPDDRKIRTNCARESKDPSYVFGNTAGVSCTHTRTGRPGARGSGDMGRVRLLRL
jgi:hypothetical protein